MQNGKKFKNIFRLLPLLHSLVAFFISHFLLDLSYLFLSIQIGAKILLDGIKSTYSNLKQQLCKIDLMKTCNQIGRK